MNVLQFTLQRFAAREAEILFLQSGSVVFQFRGGEAGVGASAKGPGLLGRAVGDEGVGVAGDGLAGGEGEGVGFACCESYNILVSTSVLLCSVREGRGEGVPLICAMRYKLNPVSRFTPILTRAKQPTTACSKLG